MNNYSSKKVISNVFDKNWRTFTSLTIVKNRWLLSASLFYLAMFFLGSNKQFEHFFIWTFNDKVLHFFAYLVLSILIYIGLHTVGIGKFLFPRTIFCFVIIFVMGAVDEIAQGFVGRDSSFDDWLVDTSAVVATLMAILICHAFMFICSKDDGKVEND